MLSAITQDKGFHDQPPRAAAMREIGPGIVCSLLLHGLAALLIFLFVLRAAPQPSQSVPFLPIDLVQVAQQTTSPPEPHRAPVPRQRAMRAAREPPSSPHPPVSLAPSRKLPPPPDTLEIRLRAFAKLRQPDASLPRLDNAGTSEDAATSDDASPGDQAGYSVRDFIRAQVERRWSLDLSRKRNVEILIHIVVAPNGRVDQAEIVDRARYATDVAWREIALSARNAVLLSSPLNLPKGFRAQSIDVTLALRPKDVLH